MKKLVALVLVLTLSMGLCANAFAYFEDSMERPETIDVLGMNGDVCGWYADLVLTEEEKEQVRGMGLSLAYEMPNESEFSQGVLNGLQSVCDDLNIEIAGLAVCENDPAVQKENLENFMALGVDYVVSQAQEVDIAAESYNPLRDAGIKLIFQGNYPTGYQAGVDCLPSQNEDFASYGILCADALAAALNYEGKVAAITMSAVNQVANTRDDAFVERIQTYENIELVEVAGIEVVSDTGTVASALLTRHPDLDGLYCTFVEPATEALEAVRGMNMTDLKIVTNDFNSMAVLDMVQDGNMCAFAVDRPLLGGTLYGVIIAYDALGKEFEHSSYLTPVTLATVENLEEEWKGGFGTDLPAEIKTALDERMAAEAEAE